MEGEKWTEETRQGGYILAPFRIFVVNVFLTTVFLTATGGKTGGRGSGAERNGGVVVYGKRKGRRPVTGGGRQEGSGEFRGRFGVVK